VRGAYGGAGRGRRRVFFVDERVDLRQKAELRGLRELSRLKRLQRRGSGIVANKAKAKAAYAHARHGVD
jgi:hypothetical protein